MNKKETIILGGGVRDYSLSLVRLIALLMIISCHILQFYHCELAWWLNVGVQIFLCISGYLYGQKNVGSIKAYYLRRIRKIGIPFLIVSVFEIAVYFLFAREHISPVSAIRTLLLDKTLYGGEHLWFVPTILFCYALTPILESFFDHNDRKRFLLTVGVGLVVIFWLCSVFTVFHPAWVSCYFIGYAMGVNEKRSYFKQKTVLLLLGVLSLMNLVQIYLDYVLRYDPAGKVERIYKMWKDYNHVWLGAFLFAGLKRLFSGMVRGKRLRGVLDLTDQYSYECYLVHQFVILGPFTLLRITEVPVVNVALCLICVGIMTFLLKRAVLLADKHLLRTRNSAPQT